MVIIESSVMTLNKFVIAALVGSISLISIAAKAEDDDKFLSWITALRIEASSKGIKSKTLDTALNNIQLIPRVIELDRSQPEFTLTFNEYLSRVVPERRVKMAQRLYNTNLKLLRSIGREFGVQPRFIVALWGIESDFGRLTGGFHVVPALATLAYDGRRSRYFRKELINALKIIDAGHINANQMKGSWAGAMGQCQFMPSSFLAFAYDYDDDGRKDIWTTLPDVFASTANYLSKSGWRGDEISARRVRLSNQLEEGVIGLKTLKALIEWQALGVRRIDGSDLPVADMRGSLLKPGGPDGPVYLVYDNYRTILKWNRSHYFATSVGHLADRIIGM